jgi:hypothetical protein
VERQLFLHFPSTGDLKRAANFPIFKFKFPTCGKILWFLHFLSIGDLKRAINFLISKFEVPTSEKDLIAPWCHNPEDHDLK